MENQTLMDDSFEDLRVSDRMKSMLKEIAKWAKFLSIIGFIGIGLMVIVALFAGTMMASMSGMDEFGGGVGMGSLITIIYLAIAALYFFPVLYLYQFAAGAQRALASGNNADIETSFEYLRKHYRFLGILMIILLGIYALIFVISIVGAAAFSGY